MNLFTNKTNQNIQPARGRSGRAGQASHGDMLGGRRALADRGSEAALCQSARPAAWPTTNLSFLSMTKFASVLGSHI